MLDEPVVARRRVAAKRPQHSEQLGGGQVLRKPRDLRHVSDARAIRVADACRFAVDEDVAARRCARPRSNLMSVVLPAPFGPTVIDDPSAFDREVDAAQHFRRAETFAMPRNSIIGVHRGPEGDAFHRRRGVDERVGRERRQNPLGGVEQRRERAPQQNEEAGCLRPMTRRRAGRCGTSPFRCDRRRSRGSGPNSCQRKPSTATGCWWRGRTCCRRSCFARSGRPPCSPRAELPIRCWRTRCRPRRCGRHRRRPARWCCG